MTNDNLISALRNMVDDIENLGAAPLTVDVNLLKQAIAAITPPEGYVLISAELLEDLADEAAAGIHQTIFHPVKRANHIRKVLLARELLAARPEVSP